MQYQQSGASCVLRSRLPGRKRVEEQMTEVILSESLDDLVNAGFAVEEAEAIVRVVKREIQTDRQGGAQERGDSRKEVERGGVFRYFVDEAQ